MTDPSDSERRGVDLGDLEEDLEEYEYPATAEELVDAFGERDIDLVEGKKRFGVVLAPYLHEEGQETFDSVEEVWNAVMNLVGSDAVGREEYSDRGIDSDDEAREEESL